MNRRSAPDRSICQPTLRADLPAKSCMRQPAGFFLRLKQKARPAGQASFL